jgi:lipid-A-disaccharide synthase
MKVVFCAGERSGDEHAAKVLNALRNKIRFDSISGMGGRALSSLGMSLVVDIEHGASVMGITEVLKTLKTHLKNLNLMKEHIRSTKPDVLVLIDYAEFNTILAKYAHSIGIKTYYIIPPQVWAWRKYRVKTLRRVLSGAALLFPFEEKFWEMEQAKFHGHPLVSEITPTQNKLELREKLGLPTSGKLLALFPGSRRQEIESHLSLFESVTKKLSGIVPVVAKTKALKSIPNGWIGCEDPINLLRAADVGIIKSGTSNLQAALAELPFVMVYKTSRLSELIGRLMLNIPQYSIVNILKPNTVKELVQDEANTESLVTEVNRLLESDNQRMILDFREIRQSLGVGDFASNIADHIIRIAG